MRKVLFAAIVLLSFLSFAASDPIEYLGVKGPLKFGDTNFEFAWSAHPYDYLYVQEYIPKGDNLNAFKNLLTIHVITVEGVTVQQHLEVMMKNLEEKGCQPTQYESPDGKESIIDFIIRGMNETEKGKIDDVEFNVHRTKQIELSNGKKALLVYMYAKRAYGDNIEPFLKEIEKDKMEYVNSMIATEMPEIKMKQ